MSNEIELKLALPRAALPALRRHPIFQGSEKVGPTATLESTYFDTPTLALKRAKVAVRTRRQQRQWLQTVKCAATSTAGLSQRPEWEQPYHGSFDFTTVDLPEARALLESLRDELQPIFTTRFRRETRVYAPHDGVRIWMMLDTGAIHVGEQQEEICELELELAEGKAEDLLQLAQALANDLPLLPDDNSKAARAYRLFLGERSAPVHASEAKLDTTMNPLEAFRTLAFSALRHWQANIVGASREHDPEFIHQLRISQRRLRALLKLFAPALPADFVNHWNEQLRSNAAQFGAARDLDVLASEIVATVQTVSDAERTAVDALYQRVCTARDEARERTQQQLDPAQQGRLVLALAAALHDLPRNPLLAAVDMRLFIAVRLSRLSRKVRRQHKAARSMVPADLHKLRIDIKQLRYGLEFFASLIPGKALGAYLRSITRTQTALGFIQDVDTARTLLTELAGTDAALCRAAGFVCGWHGPRYRKLSRKTMRKLKRLLWSPAPWQAPPR